MRWPSTTIGQLCLPTEQRDPTTSPDKPFRYIDISAIDKDAKRITTAPELLGAEAPSRARKAVRAGDVLVSTVRPNLNAVAVVPDELDGEIASTGFCVLRTNPKLAEGKFIFYRCLTPEFVNSLIAQMRGANYPAVSDGVVKRTDTPLPARKEQRRIVELLEQADGLRRQRTEADTLADRILPALFLKLFGDPARNSRSLPTERMERLAQVKRGDFRHRPRTEPRFYGGPYPFIQINDITASGIIIRTHSQTLNEKGLAISRMFPAETVVVSIAATIAASGILGFDSCFPDSLVGVRSRDKRTTQEYLLFYLRLMAAHLTRIAPQLAQKNINLEILNALDVPVPQPHSLQLFTDAVKRFVAVEQRMASSHEMVDELWRAVIHRAFTGELTAKWREAHLKELLAEVEHQARLLKSLRQG